VSVTDVVDVLWQEHCMLETRFKISTDVQSTASHLTLYRLCWSVALFIAY